MAEREVFIVVVTSEPGRGAGQFLHTHDGSRIGPAEGQWRDKWKIINVGDGKFKLQHLTGRGAGEWAHIHADYRIGPASAEWQDTFQALDKAGNKLSSIPENGVPFQVQCVSGRGNNQYWHIHANIRVGPADKMWSNTFQFISPTPEEPIDTPSINYWIKVVNCQPGRGAGQYLHTHDGNRTGPADDQWKDSVVLRNYGNGIYKIQYETGRDKGGWLHIHADYRCGPAAPNWADEFEFYVNNSKVKSIPPPGTRWKAKFLSGRGVNQWWHIHSNCRLGPAEQMWADDFQLQPAEGVAKVISLTFDTDRAMILSAAPDNILSYPVDNRKSSVPIKDTITLKKTIENKSSFERTHGFEVSITNSLTIKAGVPEIAEVESKIEIQTKTTHEWKYGEENTVTQEFSVESAIEVPPGKAIVKKLIVTTAKIDVPYKLVYETETGKVLEESGIWKGTSSTNVRIQQEDM
eukprot:TRINITY_DN4117_c0_g1_i6.p1 TRINITY_DN4117_c0_g1~~TRINITY_DN4117_c0_g1_i6.p1  ORF type:complete len:463 (-),score=103.36 TRINITY_DN4117_c0_g1_i6:80-1468(-)